MVVLDVDHPDIEEFIETKAREEDKIRALRDAGFDMDLGGRDITSVQYQNANNSVRVNDEFMRAVEEGKEFGLRARKTGEVIETVDAKALFEKIAKAAWECADPGIQYDDTINDWHTNPETGRITASNPCSEYMSLDNSSCNLACLNLLKFLARRRHLRRCAVRQGRRAGHHRDGHLDLLRRLPDRGDRRHHPRLPPARHRLRQPRRAADGDRPRLRLRRRPGAGGRDHLADDRHGVQALGRAGRDRRPLRRLRPQRRRPQAGHAQARGRQRRRPHRHLARQGRAAPGHQGVGRRRQARRAQRLPQRAGLGARPDRHDRLHDGLRHHRHRAGLLAGQVQEAGRRRVDADRQPDDPAGAAEARLHARRRSRRSSSTSPSTATSSTRRACARSTTRSSTPRWASARSRRWVTCG